MKRGLAIVVSAGVAACVPTDEAAQKTANAGPCSQTVIRGGEAVTEMPPENLGQHLVGLFTVVTGETRYNPGTLGRGRFSLLDCKAARLVRADAAQNGDIRLLVSEMRRRGETHSLQSFAAAARANRMIVEEGAFPRQEGTRAGCACGSIHPQSWYDGFPPDASGYKPSYVEPAGLPVEGTKT